VWRCWLVLLVAAYAVLIVVYAVGVAALLSAGAGLARPVGGLLLGVYAAELWAVWRWAGQAGGLRPPVRPAGYLLVAVALTAGVVVAGLQVWGR